MSSKICPVCSAAMRNGRKLWLYTCPNCGFLASSLEPTISQSESHAIDEASRAVALGSLRLNNFRRILHIITPLCPPSRILLDVGCAHGWFLEMASSKGYTVSGIEPDKDIGLIAQQKGLDVQIGYFPSDVPPDQKFDVISFNDVLEHIPNVQDVIGSAIEYLNKDGLLVINIPISSGIFYRIAGLLDRFGVHGPFDRMWQRFFPSPHISYFRSAHLQTLASRYGAELVYCGSLESLETKGLWQRLRYDRNSSVITNGILFVALNVLSPIIRLLPPDIALHVFRKRG